MALNPPGHHYPRSRKKNSQNKITLTIQSWLPDYIIDMNNCWHGSENIYYLIIMAILLWLLGSDFGLTMILNLEQYEYMRGPQYDAGVKVSFKHERQTRHIFLTRKRIAIWPAAHVFEKKEIYCTLTQVHTKHMIIQYIYAYVRGVYLANMTHWFYVASMLGHYLCRRSSINSA